MKTKLLLCCLLAVFLLTSGCVLLGDTVVGRIKNRTNYDITFYRVYDDGTEIDDALSARQSQLLAALRGKHLRGFIIVNPVSGKRHAEVRLPNKNNKKMPMYTIFGDGHITME